MTSKVWRDPMTPADWAAFSAWGDTIRRRQEQVVVEAEARAKAEAEAAAEDHDDQSMVAVRRRVAKARKPRMARRKFGR